MWQLSFRTAFVSYLIFLFAEYLRPGFVSTVFNPHWIAFIAFFLFLGWLMTTFEKAMVSIFDAGILAIILMVLIWSERLVFGDYAFLLILGVIILPFILRAHLNKLSD